MGQLLFGEILTQADVAAEGVVEEIGGLGDVAHPLVEALTVDAVEEDAAGIVWVVLEQQLCQCRLAAAALAHENGLFLPGNGQPDTAQHRRGSTRISKAGVLALDVLKPADGLTFGRFFRAGYGVF